MIHKNSQFGKSLVLRAKGIVWLASFPEVQGEFSLAGNHFSLLPGSPWWVEIEKKDWPPGLEDALKPLWHDTYGEKQQEIVIIGQNMDVDAITNRLNDCLLAHDELKLGEEAWNSLSIERGDPFYDEWYYTMSSMGNHGHDHSHEHNH